MAVDVDETYKPSEDEPFMNDRQKEYFRRKLLTWKEDILRESRETLAALQLKCITALEKRFVQDRQQYKFNRIHSE